jgi:two-component system sensor histidine kinase CreC
MRIGLRILLGYFLIVGMAAWFLLSVFVEQVKPGVRAALEDTLVDTANLLALVVADDVKAGRVDQSVILARVRSADRSQAGVKIGGIAKDALDYRVYITDTSGKVLFDSSGKDVGKDYSRWNDVYLTLQGKYGARMSREQADDDASTVMHVAAPIRDGKTVIGVLSVAKPMATVQPFVQRSEQKILRRGAVLLALSLLVGAVFAWWLNESLGRLMTYIGDAEAGRKATLPDLGNNEIGVLGRALEALRFKLEGKEYVEELMHTLAHELKSPIAAIQSSAELMQEDMPAADRQRFLGNILSQNARQRQLIDKLLALVKLEKQQALSAPEALDLPALLAVVDQDCAAKRQAKSLSLELEATPCMVQGDSLMLRQALGNLLDNAIDFAPPGSAIGMRCSIHDQAVKIVIMDSGPGVPEYAQARLFERFYSLPRPNGGKSTGLGLPFVREVVALHKGSVSVENIADGGCCATLTLPLLKVPA